MQWSDPHFGAERSEVVDALHQLARAQAPDVLVLSGDITQRARRSQFEQAQRFVASLGAAPSVAIPGNHDIPLFNVLARLVAPYAGYQRVFGQDLEPSFESDDWLVLGVNTTRWWRHKHGELNAKQVARVAQRLKLARPGQVRVVVTHQPLAVPRASERKNLVRGARQEAVRLWADSGADVILAGHIHLPATMGLHAHDDGWGVLPRPLWAVLAGSAVSRRLRHDAGNSVNILRVERTPRGRGIALTLERWDFANTRFEMTQVQSLPLELDHGC